MTEDVLEEQSEVLAKLGTSAEGAHLRARMQSACLLSDMESFKVTTGKIHNFIICYRIRISFNAKYCVFYLYKVFWCIVMLSKGA